MLGNIILPLLGTFLFSIFIAAVVFGAMEVGDDPVSGITIFICAVIVLGMSVMLFQMSPLTETVSDGYRFISNVYRVATAVAVVAYVVYRTTHRKERNGE